MMQEHLIARRQWFVEQTKPGYWEKFFSWHADEIQKETAKRIRKFNQESVAAMIFARCGFFAEQPIKITGVRNV